jgi:exo-poly-alpha-galacturonosidase
LKLCSSRREPAPTFGIGRLVNRLLHHRRNIPIVTVLTALLGNPATAAGNTTNPPTRYLITDHGAVGDGRKLNTRAIQSAIDQCAARGSGEVVIPQGTFLSGALFLKPGVNLRVEKGGVLKGSLDTNDYPQVFTRWEGVERSWTAALINATNCAGATLSGEGTLDGSGDAWERRDPRKKPMRPKEFFSAANQATLAAAAPATNGTNTIKRSEKRSRPRLVVFQNCRLVRVAGLTLKNQASWGLVFIYCEDVVADGLTIRVTDYVPSSDGIDVDSCRRVRIRNCDIQSHDDCISIKSGRDEDGLRVNRPSEDIVVEHTRFGYGHGAVALGSETSGGIRNVEVRDCVVGDDNWAAVRFKSAPARGGVMEDITYRNIQLRGVYSAFEMNLAWSGPRTNSSHGPPAIRNVKLINVSGTADSGGLIAGLTNSLIRNVSFSNCTVTADKGLAITNAADLDLSGLHLDVKEGPAILRRD